jgi:hypothetical protein
MKVAAIALSLAPLLCFAADPLLNMAEGTTWNYELIQERPSTSYDLSEPNDQERIEVTYRLGAGEKLDNKDWARLEVYRDGVFESADLIQPNQDGIICSARMDGQGNVTRINPPQWLVKRPFKTGTAWDFEGTIGDTKVNQHYEIADEEDVDLPAGKFHAWRIHCEQTLPAKATIDRWFVPTTGFVKVETVMTDRSGGLLQKTTLKLKEPPKIATAPQQKISPPEKFSVTVSGPKGELEFKSDTPAIYARWRGHGLPTKAEVRATFIAENVADVSADYQIDESTTTAPAPDSNGSFTLSKPESGWTPGNYRVEFFLADEPAATVKFKISK